MHPLIVRQPDGTLVDHVALGVPDIEKGLEYVESFTGFRPVVGEVSAKAGHSFVRAQLSLGGEQFLEVIGPNCAFEGEPEGIGGRAAALPAPRVPSVTEWKARDDGKELAATSGCRIVDFTVHHPEPEKVRKVYDALGVIMLVRRGEEPHLRLLLETPRDDVILS